MGSLPLTVVCCRWLLLPLLHASRAGAGPRESRRLGETRVAKARELVAACPVGAAVFAASGKAVLCADVVGGVPGCFARPLFFGRGAGTNCGGQGNRKHGRNSPLLRGMDGRFPVFTSWADRGANCPSSTPMSRSNGYKG